MTQLKAEEKGEQTSRLLIIHSKGTMGMVAPALMIATTGVTISRPQPETNFTLSGPHIRHWRATSFPNRSDRPHRTCIENESDEIAEWAPGQLFVKLDEA